MIIKNNMKKILYIFIIIFLMINLLLPYFGYAGNSPTGSVGNTASALPRPVATVVKGGIVSAQVILAGVFVIQLTVIGIQYFIVVAASEKASLKNRFFTVLIYGSVAMLGLFLIINAI